MFDLRIPETGIAEELLISTSQGVRKIEEVQNSLRKGPEAVLETLSAEARHLRTVYSDWVAPSG